MSEKSKLIHKSHEDSSHKRYGSVSYKYTLLDSVPKTHFTKKQCILVSGALLFIALAFVVTLIIGLPKLREKRNEYLRASFPISDTQEAIYKTAAITVDGEPCAKIGKNILLANGSAVDAAIAMLFCDEIANPQSLGIGGGFFMIIYNRTTKTSEVIDAREVAPKSANQNMFNENVTLSQKRVLSIAVPGQIRGMLAAHQKYGRLNWAQLVEPSINLSRDGIVVSKTVENALKDIESHILSDQILQETFINNATGKLYKTGEILKRPKLSETLQQIAKNGEDFYTGTIANNLVNDIKNISGIITLDDLKSYQSKFRDSINISIHNGNYTLLTVPPPGSGAVVAYVLNILDSFNMSCIANDKLEDKLLMYHRLIESLKFGYAKKSQLADPDFTDVTQTLKDLISYTYANSTRLLLKDTTQPMEYYGLDMPQVSDKGTGHLAVISSDGSAVSVTSTINSLFGSLKISASTGIILNNEMDDFSKPDIKGSVNLIAPGKRPLSSMSPSIIIDKNGNPKLVTGGIGGTRIVSSVVQVIFNALWQCNSIKEATDALRLYYDVNSNEVLYEQGFPKVYLDGLFRFGHQFNKENMASSVFSILQDKDNYHAMVDHRKGGSTDGL